MTVALLSKWGNQPAGTLFTTDATTEAAMIAAKQATATLTGAIPWVPPGNSPNVGPAVTGSVDPVTGRIKFSGGSAAIIIPPQATGRYMGTFGDSIAYNTGLAAFKYLRGAVVVAEMFSNRAIRFDNSANFGIGGDTTVMMLARIDTAIAAQQALDVFAVYISAGTNDLPNGVPVATTIANLKTILTKYRDAGIYPILRSQPVRSNSSWGASAGIGQRGAARINSEMATWIPTRDAMFMHDITEFYIDSTSATSDPASTLTVDGLHPSATGGFLEGFSLANSCNSWFGLSNLKRIANTSLTSHFHATDNPWGNILNGGAGADYAAMQGSNALTGTGYAGNYSNGITPSRSQGAGTMTGAIENAPVLVNGVDTGRAYQRQVLTFAGTAASDIYQLRYNMGWDATFRNWATGDKVYFELEVELVGVSNLVTVKPIITEGWGSFLSVTGADEQARLTESIPAGSFKFIISTPIITLSTYAAGGLVADIQIKTSSAAALAGTIKIGKPILRKVA